jgi:hypothetical protein
MPAATAAAISAGDMIKFRKNAVSIFHIIVNAFGKFSSESGKWIFLLSGNKLFNGQQAIITETTIKGTGKICFGGIAE